jgi:hypothetical protein
VDVTFEIVDMNNNTVQGPMMVTIPPNTGNYLGAATGAAAWCRFTVSGSTKNVHGIAIYDSNVGYTMSLPAN